MAVRVSELIFLNFISGSVAEGSIVSANVGLSSIEIEALLREKVRGKPGDITRVSTTMTTHYILCSCFHCTKNFCLSGNAKDAGSEDMLSENE